MKEEICAEVKGAIAIQMEDLTNAINRAGEVKASIIQKLEPVLSVVPTDEQPSAVEDDDGGSPLTNELRTFTVSLHCLTAQYESILARIEL